MCRADQGRHSNTQSTTSRVTDEPWPGRGRRENHVFPLTVQFSIQKVSFLGFGKSLFPCATCFHFGCAGGKAWGLVFLLLPTVPAGLRAESSFSGQFICIITSYSLVCVEGRLHTCFQKLMVAGFTSYHHESLCLGHCKGNATEGHLICRYGIPSQSYRHMALLKKKKSG